MKIKVRALAAFRHILGKEREVELAEGARIKELLEALMAERRELKAQLFEDSRLKEEVNILVKGQNIAALQGLDTELSEGDEVAIFPAAIGG